MQCVAIGGRRHGQLSVLLTLTVAAALGVLAGLPLGDLPFWLADIAHPQNTSCETIVHCLVDGDVWGRLVAYGVILVLLLGSGTLLVLAGCLTSIVSRHLALRRATAAGTPLPVVGRATVAGAAMVLCGCVLITSVVQNLEWS